MAYTQNELPSGLDAKATPVDADSVVVGDSADSGRVKKTTFAQLKTWIEALTSYFNVSTDTLDDITDGSTYVKSTNDYTSAEKTVVGNTSGTNTGDQDIDDVTPTTIKGDVMVENGSNVIRLPIGTNDQVLTADSAEASGVKWAASASGFADPMTTRGDVIIKDASNNTTRLGIGTNGQVLKSDGTDIAWGTPAGGGDMTAAVYDPTTVAGDCFDVDNHVDGTTNKVYSATEKTKLAGVETAADVTDTTNVTAAGALMDSEVDADIKTLVLPASTTISAFGKTLVDDADAAAARATLGAGTLDNVVEDTTPQLGGDFDVNGNSIVSTSNGDIVLAPNGTGIVKGELKRFMVQLLADDADQATDTTIAGDFRISNRAITIKAVGAYVDTAGTTGTSTIDINEEGTSILSTKITIDTGEKSSETAATAPVVSDSAIAADAIVSFDIDGIHTTAAKGLKVWVDYVYA